MMAFKKHNLSMTSVLLIVACTHAQLDSAQMARPTAAPGTPPDASLESNASASDPASPQSKLYYVCGGPGTDARSKSPDQGHPFNMGVSFISAANGAPLSNVAVKVKRHGRVLMDFVAQGSQCLFLVPEADYRIEGTYRGEMKFEIVQTGTMNAQIKW